MIIENDESLLNWMESSKIVSFLYANCVAIKFIFQPFAPIALVMNAYYLYRCMQSQFVFFIFTFSPFSVLWFFFSELRHSGKINLKSSLIIDFYDPTTSYDTFRSCALIDPLVPVDAINVNILCHPGKVVWLSVHEAHIEIHSHFVMRR